MPLPIPTVTAGSLIDPTTYGNSVGAAINSLLPSAVGKSPAIKVKTSAVQSVATATQAALTWDQEDFDTDAFHSTSSNTSRLTVPAGLAGLYLVTFSTYCAAGTGGAGAWIAKNGVFNTPRYGFNQVPNDSVNGVGLAGTDTIALAATDYVEVVVFQNSGAAKNFNLLAPYIGFFSMVRIGPS